MKLILLVDDEPVLRSVLRQFLEFSGYEVVEAGNGAGALALARQRRPDIVLTDLLMPHKDGLDFCRELRTDPELFDVPVLFVTARITDIAQRAEMDRVGDGFVVKPFEPDHLLRVIDTLLA
jgi:two-component system alkaline phosphatase synthesis response regulator PhoP